jgi:hypothetical protein
MDLRNKMVGFAYGGFDDASASAAAASLIKTVHFNPLIVQVSPSHDSPVQVDPIFSKLNEVLVRNAAGVGTFFVGSAATSPDFHAWEMCDQVLLSPLRSPPPLQLITDSFSSISCRHFTSWRILCSSTPLSAPSTASEPFSHDFQSTCTCSLLMRSQLCCSTPKRILFSLGFFQTSVQQ